MLVVVVSIIVSVHMFVDNYLVFVDMGMAIHGKQTDAHYEQQCRHQVNRAERFAQHRHR